MWAEKKFVVEIDEKYVDQKKHQMVTYKDYTRSQINQDRMIFGDFSLNSEPIFLKFCKGHFLFKS